MVLLLILAAGLAACSQQPAPINYGSDECAHCRMMITDARFASQLVTKTGKAITFDSIECMAAYSGDHKPEVEGAQGWVSDFSNPGQWLQVDEARIIKSQVIKSPMGASLLALKAGPEVQKHLEAFPGAHVEWQGLVR